MVQYLGNTVETDESSVYGRTTIDVSRHCCSITYFDALNCIMN